MVAPGRTTWKRGGIATGACQRAGPARPSCDRREKSVATAGAFRKGWFGMPAVMMMPIHKTMATPAKRHDAGDQWDSAPKEHSAMTTALSVSTPRRPTALTRCRWIGGGKQLPKRAPMVQMPLTASDDVFERIAAASADSMFCKLPIKLKSPMGTITGNGRLPALQGFEQAAAPGG